MHEIFEQRNVQYNFCSQIDFQLGSVKTVSYGLRALRYLCSKISKIVPLNMKNLFKSWKHKHCPCDLNQP